MSFSSDTKTALCALEVQDICCKKALLAGILTFANIYTFEKIKLITENESVSSLLLELLHKLYGINGNLYVSVKKTPPDAEGGGEKAAYKSYKVTVSSKKDISLMSDIQPEGTTSLYRINTGIFKCDGCRRAFVRGAFLSSGTISDPRSSYHCELSTPYLNLSRDTAALLEDLSLSPKTAVRKSSNVIYYKGSEQIVDFLNLIGATNASFDMMNNKIYKDIRNNTNRVVNCETANMEKAISAAAQVAEAIQYLIKTGKIDDLGEELKKTAQLRMDNMELGLAELGALMTPKLTKSGINHRLKKIVSFRREAEKAERKP